MTFVVRKKIVHKWLCKETKDLFSLHDKEDKSYQFFSLLDEVSVCFTSVVKRTTTMVLVTMAASRGSVVTPEYVNLAHQIDTVMRL